MKGLIKKLIILSLTGVFISLSSFSWGAPPPISFDGPKYTYLDDENKPNVPMMKPGDFAIYNVLGSSQLDLVVPTIPYRYAGLIQGLNNSPTPPDWSGPDNSYFLHNYQPEKGFSPHQAIAGNFDNNATKDIIILNEDSVSGCLDYNGGTTPYPGAACSTGYWQTQLFVDSPTNKILFHPWAGAVGKFVPATTTDSVALVGWASDPSGITKGYLIVGTPVGGSFSVTYGPKEVTLGTGPGALVGIPLSVAIADFTGDGKSDIAVGSMPGNGNGGGAFINIYNNNGSSFDVPSQAVWTAKQDYCYHLTDLDAFDPDGDNKFDLVATCYDRMVNESWQSGPVVILKNGSPFSLQQEIQNLNYPYTSAIAAGPADFNKDGISDYVICENGGKDVRVLTGKDAFHVDDPVGHVYMTQDATHSLAPKYCNVADMNGDNRTDIVLTASDAGDFPNPGSPKLVDAKSDNIRLVTDNVGTFIFDEALYVQALAKVQVDNAAANNKKYFRLNTSPKFGSQIAILAKDVPADKTKAVAATTNYVPSEGVVVLLNNPPLSIESNCDTNVVKVHCDASEGATITSCTLENPNFPISTTTFTSGIGTAHVEGTFTLPSGNQVYTFTMVAKDSASKTYKQDFVVDRTNCPGAGACPSTDNTPKAQVFWDDPWTVCIHPSLSSQAVGKEVIWTQLPSPGVSTSIFNDIDGKLMAQSASSSGECIKGRFNPMNNIAGNVSVDLQYSIKGGVGPCPANVTRLGAIAESGSDAGIKCSLSPDIHSSYAVSTLLTLLGLPMGSFLLSRRRSRKNK